MQHHIPMLPIATDGSLFCHDDTLLFKLDQPMWASRKKLQELANSTGILLKNINPFYPKVPFLYPLKTLNLLTLQLLTDNLWSSQARN